MSTVPVFFADAAALRRWLAKHAATAPELVVGFSKKGTGIPSVSWAEAVDEALCVGWIDGVRRRIDDKRYSNRFSPRKRGSHWSAINVRRVAELKKSGRMTAAGLAAFATRNRARTGGEWYTQRTTVKLTPAEIKAIRRNATAWKYYDASPPSYKKMAHWWIAGAKKSETRARRLRKLIVACAEGRRLY